MTSVLEVREVSKHYGGVAALSKVSLKISQGEIVAVVGDNGAGKSTLMKIIGGVIQPDLGEILVDDISTSFRTPREARAAGIEVVYQELALADDLDVAANLFLGREISRRWGPLRVLDKRAMQSRAREIVAGFGIDIPTVCANVRGLSGGQRQGVAIGRAVGWGSRLVIMDEPTAALGVRETGRIESVIKNLQSKGIAILLVSHNLDQVFRVSNRIIVLRRGREVGSRRTSETNADDVVSMIMGSPKDDLDIAARDEQQTRLVRPNKDIPF